jgi:hypothetical protein
MLFVSSYQLGQTFSEFLSEILVQEQYKTNPIRSCYIGYLINVYLFILTYIPVLLFILLILSI